jgi:hypothetical protein
MAGSEAVAAEDHLLDNHSSEGFSLDDYSFDEALEERREYDER